MPIQPLKFLDFAPDLDPTTPGICLDMNNMMPVMGGYRTMPFLDAVTNALPSTCLGAAGVNQSYVYIVAGTANQLYQLSSGLWGSSGLSGVTATGPWRFAVFGTHVLATAPNGSSATNPYYANGSDFQLLTGSPPAASIVVVTDNAVILVLPGSQTFYSNLSDTASWTPNFAAQVYEITVGQTIGNITACHRLRNGMSLYKRNALHYGIFVGGALGWDLITISEQVGVAGNECVVSTGDYDYIWGPDDFWLFDGYNLNRIPNNLKEWAFRTLDNRYAANIFGRYDIENDLIVWHFASSDANPIGTLDSYICLYLRTGRWGCGHFSIETPLQGVTTQLSELYQANQSGVVQLDHTLYLNDTDPTQSITTGVSTYITTGDFGDYQRMFQTRRIRPGFSTYPNAPSGSNPTALTQCTPLNQYVGGNTPVAGQATPISPDGWFNLMNTARLQRFRIDLYEQAELVGGQIDINPQGEV